MTGELIQSDPAIMMGKPVIAGTRITVELILEKLAAGETIEHLLEAHPRLTREAIHAAWRLPLRRYARMLSNPLARPIQEPCGG